MRNDNAQKARFILSTDLNTSRTASVRVLCAVAYHVWLMKSVRTKRREKERETVCNE